MKNTVSNEAVFFFFLWSIDILALSCQGIMIATISMRAFEMKNFMLVMLGSSLAIPLHAAVIIPVGAEPVVVMEQSIEEPHKTTEHYSYAKGEVFNRWVFNPWMKMEVTPEGQKATINDVAKTSGYLSAELNASTEQMAPGKTYSLLSEISIACPEKTTQNTQDDRLCVEEYVVRCYGYVAGEWTMKVNERRKLAQIPDDGLFKVSDVELDRERCDSYVNIIFKSNVFAKADHHLFKSLKLRFEEKPVTITKAKVKNKKAM